MTLNVVSNRDWFGVGTIGVRVTGAALVGAGLWSTGYIAGRPGK